VSLRGQIRDADGPVAAPGGQPLPAGVERHAQHNDLSALLCPVGPAALMHFVRGPAVRSTTRRARAGGIAPVREGNTMSTVFMTKFYGRLNRMGDLIYLFKVWDYPNHSDEQYYTWSTNPVLTYDISPAELAALPGSTRPDGENRSFGTTADLSVGSF